MKRYILLFFLAFSFNFFSLFTQDSEKKEEPRQMFVEAESYLLYEEYEDALPIYLKLLKLDPTNDNLNFKVGLCYLNIPYEKEKSIPYLEKAVQNISDNYKMNNFKERQAPLDALFYLGNAYRINNQLDKALSSYQEFKKRLDPNVYDEEIVDEQIATVERARRYLSKPIYFVARNVGQPINSKYAERNAVVSGDEKILVYNVKLPFYEALYFSKNIDGKWQAPVNVITELGVDGDVSPTGLSFDGKEMIIYRNDNYDGNLYVSRYVNGHWTPITRLNDKINTRYWESHGSLSPDGTTLYFTSNRKGGFGGLDIYTATRSNVNSNDWGNIKNMGPDINTKYNEESPFVSQDGKVLYFSSYGHFNMGGYDVFYSSLLDNGHWSVPLNMGYPLNTTDDDTYFVPVDNGNFAYITRYYPDGYGKTDIYKVELFSEQHPRKFILRGLLSMQPSLQLNQQNKIQASIINKASRDTISKFFIDPNNPKFDTPIVAGNYQLVIQGQGIEKLTQDFSIDKNQANNEVSLSAMLKEGEKEVKSATVAEKTAAQQVNSINFERFFYKVFDNKIIPITLPFKKGTNIEVEISLDSVYKRTDKFEMNRDNQIYSYQPSEGTNVLKFTAIQLDNTISKGEVIIIYQPISDTITLQEFAKELDRRMNESQYYKEMMKMLVKDNDTLKKYISEMDIDNNKLLSLDDMNSYLKSQAKLYNISNSEIDSIFKSLLAQQKTATKLLLNALSELSHDTLHAIVDTLSKSKVFTVPDAVKALINKTEHRKSTNEQLLLISTELSWKADPYYYLYSLRKVSKGNLKATLDTLDLQANNIANSQELLNYLTDNAAQNKYSISDIYSAFFSLPLFTNSSGELLFALKGINRDDKIKAIFELQNMKQIKSVPLFGKQLWNEIEKNKVNPLDLVKLLITANDSVAFNEYVSNLLALSRGNLNKTFSQIDIKEQGIESPADMERYLLNNKLIDKQQLISLNLYIASKNLLEISQSLERRPSAGIQPVDYAISIVFILLLIIIFAVAYKKFQEK
jgi:hypothetical protein